MKLTEFNELCIREWEDRHGDILKLYLTPDSAHELSCEQLLAGGVEQMVLYVRQDQLADIAAGAVLTHMVNPITRTAIEIVVNDYRDGVEVFYSLIHEEESQEVS